MLQSFGVAAIICLGGMFLAKIWTYVIYIASLPGSFLLDNYRLTYRKQIGAFLVVVGQLFTSLTFTAFAVSYVYAASSIPGRVSWPMWIAAFFASSQPMMILNKQCNGESVRYVKARTEGDDDAVISPMASNGADYLPFCIAVEAVAFFLFAFFPALMTPWVWVPFVAQAIRH